jgi:hypothetical protein
MLVNDVVVRKLLKRKKGFFLFEQTNNGEVKMGCPTYSLNLVFVKMNMQKWYSFSTNLEIFKFNQFDVFYGCIHHKLNQINK